MWQVKISPSITSLYHPLLLSTCLLYGMAVIAFEKAMESHSVNQARIKKLRSALLNQFT
jgi:hypothetical protein